MANVSLSMTPPLLSKTLHGLCSLYIGQSHQGALFTFCAMSKRFLREAVSLGSIARQADQGLKHECFQVKCSQFLPKFNRNCIPSALMNFVNTSKIQMHKGKARFTRNWLPL